MTAKSFEEIQANLRSTDPAVLQDAINDLIARYDERLRRILCKTFSHPLDPANTMNDYSQKIWIKLTAYIRAGKFDLETEAGFVSLLKRMAQQSIADHVPRRPRPVPLGPGSPEAEGHGPDVPDGHSGPLTKAVKKEILDLVRKEVSPQQWRWMCKRFLEDRSWLELAREELTVEGGVPPTDVEVRKEADRIRVGLMDRLFPTVAERFPEFQRLVAGNDASS